MNIDIGLVIAGIFGSSGLIALIIFAIKAQVHKQNAPLKNRVEELEKKMTIVESLEENHKTIIELLQNIPSEIDDKIKKREEDRKETLDLKYATKQELNLKQDK